MWSASVLLRRHTAKRVPVIAGTGSNDTAFAIEISKEAEEAGADALLLVTPYYNKTSQAGLIAHYTAIANAVTLPCIIYNVPSRTGVNLQPATLAELAKLPNVNAVKEASGNISQVADVAALCGEELNIYSGNDDQIVPILSPFSCSSRLFAVLPENHAAQISCACCGATLCLGKGRNQIKMTDLIIQGINGRMGHTLVEKISARSDCRIVAGVDQKAGQIGDIPVYASLEDLPEAKGNL